MLYNMKLGKAERKVCTVHMINMNTALPSSHISQKRKYGNYTPIYITLTNDVFPRDSQDDKILPEHIKSNPKVSFFKHIKSK